MTRPRTELAVAFGSGLLFAVGLALAGMTQPSKVIGFFDFGRGLESWDPSLGFVILGGLLIQFPVFRIVRQRESPLVAARFRLPTRTDIDWRLVVGAMLFGTGWGLAGYCPGPAITSVTSGAMAPLIVVGSMLAGMKISQWATAHFASAGAAR